MLTKEQKAKICKAVAELAADYITDGWGEPLKDVDQSRHWPTAKSGASDEEMDALSNDCNDYLDTAARKIAAQLRKLT